MRVHSYRKWQGEREGRYYLLGYIAKRLQNGFGLGQTELSVSHMGDRSKFLDLSVVS